MVNQAEGLIHDTESKISEFRSQLPAEEVCIMQVGKYAQTQRGEITSVH